jgi:hypothetical protein
MHVKNVNLANQELADGNGGTYKGDAYGTFNLPDKFAKELLATPGFMRCRMTEETQAADKALEDAEKKLKRAKAALRAAQEAAIQARAQADLGKGTSLDSDEEEEPEEPEAPETPEESEPDPEPEEEEEEAEEDAEDEEEDDEDETTETAEQIAKGERPNMKWKSDRLIRYCQALGIAADSSWTKAQCFAELEELEED